MVSSRPDYWIEDVESSYKKPCSWPIIVHRIPLISGAKKRSVDERKALEAAKINEHLQNTSPQYVISLDERGRLFDSKQFSYQLSKIEETVSSVAFIIGGPDGIAHEIIQKSNLITCFKKQMNWVVILWPQVTTLK